MSLQRDNRIHAVYFFFFRVPNEKDSDAGILGLFLVLFFFVISLKVPGKFRGHGVIALSWSLSGFMMRGLKWISLNKPEQESDHGAVCRT